MVGYTYYEYYLYLYTQATYLSDKPFLLFTGTSIRMEGKFMWMEGEMY